MTTTSRMWLSSILLFNNKLGLEEEGFYHPESYQRGLTLCFLQDNYDLQTLVFGVKIF